ncbi:MAG: hypothetical protein J6Y29_06570 [Clostridiales bacterium]|nr:hypothetical protein [Clostridiales bacterium]
MIWENDIIVGLKRNTKRDIYNKIDRIKVNVTRKLKLISTGTLFIDILRIMADEVEGVNESGVYVIPSSSSVAARRKIYMGTSIIMKSYLG